MRSLQHSAPWHQIAYPSSIGDHLEVLERFVVQLYNRTSTEMNVNEARKQLFSQKGRPVDGLPPTQAALLEHIKRAAVMSGHRCL